MKLKVWGARGSVPTPGAAMDRFGGNTSCVEVLLRSGERLILDAGTGIRALGFAVRPDSGPLNILLTHLHLDHIQGLMFFAPFFRADSRIRIWGPSSPDASLEQRIARYISAPLSPVEVRELPSHVSFLDAPPTRWEIGGATISAGGVTHRGPTLGYRIEDGDETLCYIPDHEPALAESIAEVGTEWISGFDLAHGADLLIHDCQYADGEYPEHVGWGHSGISDAMTFAARAEPARTMMFHHDPMHTDEALLELHGLARERYSDAGGDGDRVLIASEGCELDLAVPHPAPAGATG